MLRTCDIRNAVDFLYNTVSFLGYFWAYIASSVINRCRCDVDNACSEKAKAQMSLTLCCQLRRRLPPCCCCCFVLSLHPCRLLVRVITHNATYTELHALWPGDCNAACACMQNVIVSWDIHQCLPPWPRLLSVWWWDDLLDENLPLNVRTAT